MLLQLTRLRYIRYIPQKKTPFIVYTTGREEKQFVRIPKPVYEDRKRRFKNRITSMIDYVKNDHVCRNRILLTYFDEKNHNDCGCCDVCLEKNKTGLSNFEFNRIKSDLMHELTQNSLRLTDLVNRITAFENEKTITVIRFLVDEGILSLKDDTLSVTKIDN
jgi:ATP-dependent DNA helicase RecQ